MIVRNGAPHHGFVLACVHRAFALFSPSFNLTKFTFKLKIAVFFTSSLRGNFPTTTTNRPVIQAPSPLCSEYATPAGLSLSQERQRFFIRAKAFTIIVSLAMCVRRHLEQHSLLKEMEENSARIAMTPVMQRWENIIFRYTEEVLERLPARKRHQTAQFAILGYLDLFADNTSDWSAVK